MKSAIGDGALTVDAVGAACGAGTDCGSCQSMIEDMIEEALDGDSVHVDSRGRAHLALSRPSA